MKGISISISISYLLVTLFTRVLASRQYRKGSLSTSTLRKEVRSLSSDELDAYFSALWTYKTTGREDNLTYMSTYNDAIGQHAMAAMNSTVDQAHQYAAFMIWHGIYVREVEIALQSIDPSVSIPYWDWTIDSNSSIAESVVLTSQYFGTSDSSSPYVVSTGRMAYWDVSDNPFAYISWQSPYGYLRGKTNYNSAPYVTRYPSNKINPPSQAVADKCISQSTFHEFWECIWGVAGSMQGQSFIHGGVHENTGGQWKDTSGSGIAQGDVCDPITSPNDPLFFSHHAQLDRLWYQWKERTGVSLFTDSDPCGVFYGGDVANPQPSGHNLQDYFYPQFYLGGAVPLSLSDACYLLQPDIAEYSYEA